MFDVTQFHFIRPWALLFIVPAFILFWLYSKQQPNQSGWAQLIDQHLLNWLMPDSSKQKNNSFIKFSLLAFWLIAILALSGPSWRQLPKPTFSTNTARVLLLDLSLSMDAEDVKPSRLSRAKYKVRDLLALTKDGQMGLVVYAGDGFILSPLTTDSDTIDNLVGALATNIMPIMGSRADKGMSKAIELLKNAGQTAGDIIWITDGAEENELENIEEQLQNTSYGLKILAIGTAEGSPIRMRGGTGFLKDSLGNIVIPKLQYHKLVQFSQDIGASITPLTADNGDITTLLKTSVSPLEQKLEQQDIFADTWEDSGFWLLLLLLPLVLLSFRNKHILGCVLLFSFMGHSQQASATVIDHLFLNNNQKGEKLLQQEKFEEAYQTFDDTNWQAVAAYRNGDYLTAQELLDHQNPSLTDIYNQGNAFALQGLYQQAIDNYAKVLASNPDHEDAKYNKEVIEKLLQQQQEEQQGEDQQEQQNEQQEQQEQQQNQEQNQEQQQDSESDADSQMNEQQQQEQQQELTEQELQDQFEEQEKDQELEQWLRRIPDDPGGLLRRKMYLEYRRRGHNQQVEKNW